MSAQPAATAPLFDEAAVFPARLAFGSVGGPRFVTEVVETDDGHEQRNQRRASPLYVYDLAVPLRTQAERAELDAFFRAMRGRLVGFRFRDWADFRAVDGVAAPVPGQPGRYQLRKTYRAPGQSTWAAHRVIRKPVPGTVRVRVNGGTSGAAVDHATGIVDVGAVGATVTADFDFDVPVRFGADVLRWTWVDRTEAGGYLYQPEALQLVEYR